MISPSIEKKSSLRDLYPLAAAQKVTISVPGKVGEKSRSFEISRVGDKLTIIEPQLVIEDAVAGAQALAR
jgi:hypothetical protein